jgi:hypothetical protein
VEVTAGLEGLVAEGFGEAVCWVVDVGLRIELEVGVGVGPEDCEAEVVGFAVGVVPGVFVGAGVVVCVGVGE